MDKKDVNDNFIKAINYLLENKLVRNKADICQQFGISASKFSEILNKRMLAGTELLSALCESYGISPDWLLTGTGTMLRTTQHVSRSTHPAQSTHTPQATPLLTPEALAQPAHARTPAPHYVVPLLAAADFLMPVAGPSMIPRYNPGDIVACKDIPLQGLFFQWNKAYVLSTDQGALIKRVMRGPSPGLITCASDNERYEPFELKISQIHALAIIVGTIRQE